ncbi:MAG: bifunctional phosphopantothenoylcysteine decarboxylase/phosphopantothenate--cysteine ligase CoaBC [Bacteroidales bacterium]|nr:bifunctional phosphopantothenoylcysteine decarboxylase/phosphopantothenate--cysteine ligase CoaBC [Bacteroidales bacterium]
MLRGKKILVGVTGSIAAYKIPFLVRLLVKEGAEVKVVCTEMATHFVTPLTLSTLSGNPVYTDFFDSRDGSWHSHVDLGHWADVYLLAPVSATTLGKMANGIADNLLLATYLAAKCPVLFAPAMDLDMFNHPTTNRNIKTLVGFGNHLLEPETGELASGLTGPGRMQEPEHILSFLKDFFKKKKELNGKNVLVSAGPTYEPIDPVRFIGNFSSGKMGFAIAETLADMGARVILVTGPTSLNTHNQNIERYDVNTAQEMLTNCQKFAEEAHIVIMSAAVADFTPVSKQSKKIKEKNKVINLELKPTTDILKTLGAQKKQGQIVIGFALETDDELENASRKLKNKNLDLIVLNSLQDKNAGFGHNTNKVTFINKAGRTKSFALKTKKEVAIDLAEEILDMIKTGN